MKIWLSILFSIFMLSARGNEIDSLTVLLEGLPENEQKLEVLHQLWKSNFPDSISKAIYYAEKEKELAGVLKNEAWLAKAYYSVGYLSTEQGYIGKAISNYVNAVELFKSLRNYSQLSDVYYNLAGLFLKAEDYSNAQLYYEESLSLSLRENLDNTLSWTYLGLGKSYSGLERHEKALSAFQNALVRANADKDPYTINLLYNTIGELFQKQKMYKKARDSFYKSIVDETLIEDLAIAYNNIGETYLEEGNHLLSKEFLTKSLELKQELDDDVSKVITYVNFGKLLTSTKDYIEAKKYLNKAVELASLNVIDKGAVEALNLLNQIHNLEAEDEIYPTGQDMLRYENIRTAQIGLLNRLNNELAPLKNRYLLQVNYEVPMLSTQLSNAINSKNINSMLAAIAAAMSLIAIMFMAYYMRKVFTARKMLSKF